MRYQFLVHTCTIVDICYVIIQLGNDLYVNISVCVNVFPLCVKVPVCKCSYICKCFLCVNMPYM